ncbi:MAG: hypothetical protein AB7Q97_03360 [Gammaproteobacteria bacterium]
MIAARFLPAYAALVAVAFGCRPVAAADANGNYAVLGAGQVSCFAFQRDSAAAGATERYRGFVFGYITAYNTFMAETYSIMGETSADALLDRVGDYCQDHPVVSFEHAVQAVIEQLAEGRYRSAPRGGWNR